MTHRFKHYDIVMVLFSVVVLVSNICATKLIEFGPYSMGDTTVFPRIIADGGAVLFPLAYILGDVLTEVYGYRHARRAIWVGFVTMLLAVITFTIVRYLPPAAAYNDQQSFERVLGFFPRIVAASFVAYLFGEFINSYVLAKVKIATAGRHLWARLIGSTVVAEFFDTVIFCLIAFGGVISGNDMMIYIAVGWIFKTSCEVVLLPVTYAVIGRLKRSEDVDHFDTDTDFTPLKVSV